jgi:hypothetical protein
MSPEDVNRLLGLLSSIGMEIEDRSDVTLSDAVDIAVAGLNGFCDAHGLARVSRADEGGH